MAEDWTNNEVEIIVAAYFDMLAKELSGIHYVKAEIRRGILPLLKNRSEASIEFKNRNISAVLARMGQPYIPGYLPAYNYQKVLLEEAVIARLRERPEIEKTFRSFSEAEAVPKQPFFESIVEDLPERETVLKEPDLVMRSPVKVNYLEVEQANRRLGKLGENIVLEYEKWRLVKAGKESLINKIEWVSETQGDGLGYDILSRNVNGTDRYIEVKSTKLTKEAPFFFSEREYLFSKLNRSNFHLYRVFNLREAPKLFIANGCYDEFCNIRPTQYKGAF